MRRAEFVIVCAMLAVPAFAQNNTAQNYNRADTFEPGKKYTCVPSADHKGWDCNEAGKADVKSNDGQPPRTATADEPTAHAADAPPTTAPAPQPTSRSTLPSYLTNAAANHAAPIEGPPSTVSAAAAHANAPSSTPTRMAAPAEPLPPPRSPDRPPAPARATHPPVVETASGGGDFMSLPGDHFVIEMAHATRRSELDATKSSMRVPSGDLYEVHLRQNGADAWLLLWGGFDTLDAARAARNTISASATPGWPRRIAPLQAEARRVSP